MTKLSPNDVERLVEWRERGMSRKRIAARLGVTPFAVYYHGLKAGLPSRIGRCGPNPFTPEEDETVTRMRIDGATSKAIGEAIGRPTSSVHMRLRILANRD